MQFSSTTFVFNIDYLHIDKNENSIFQIVDAEALPNTSTLGNQDTATTKGLNTFSINQFNNRFNEKGSHGFFLFYLSLQVFQGTFI